MIKALAIGLDGSFGAFCSVVEARPANVEEPVPDLVPTRPPEKIWTDYFFQLP